MSRPDAREAIRLQLDANGLALRPGASARVLQQTELVLDVVAVLVGDHVTLGEWSALRAEAGAQLVEEARVEVDPPVLRAIERPARAARRPASALNDVREDDRLGLVIGLATQGEVVIPELLDAVHESDDTAIGSLVRVRAGLAIGERRGALDRGRTRVVGERIDAKEERGDEDDDPDPAATDQHRAADAATARVLDLRRVEARVPSEAHPCPRRKPRATGRIWRLGGGIPVGTRRCLREQPRQRFGHRGNERDVLRMRDELAREQPKCRAERGAFGLVSDRPMLVLPRNEGTAAFGHVEDRFAEVVPLLATVALFDGVKRASFRGVETFALTFPVLVPSPRGALDARCGEHTEVAHEPVALVRAHRLRPRGFGARQRDARPIS